ncbi:hypothetical protein LTR78_006994 [Recurvomyces mirabilis]|uniref:Thioredoxin domain-containing protein n=1 Tax=Recurvomyces mirabilis TaxID=574656 RepID=A0AAE0WK17_9PEZI|nr:hypothetical protein LTR78_006994 [Recurvomyces mirabilis]KAK5153378.1 hypothetical protein LTS14_007547 [Recurvomyces mirabilis]
MSAVTAGEQFPGGVKFEWAPITSPDPSVCGIPQTYDASEEFKNKKVVLVSVPGAFTPGCHANHVPPYMKDFSKLQEKGVDLVVVIGFNDAFVMNGWGKVNGAGPDSKILFMSDTKSHFAKSMGWMAGVGERNARFAMIIEKSGIVTYAEKEDSIGGVSVSGADVVLSKL